MMISRILTCTCAALLTKPIRLVVGPGWEVANGLLQRMSTRGVGIIRGDVLEDVFEPAWSLVGPRYCCHERMRCATSLFEMVRFASESASPRWTIT